MSSLFQTATSLDILSKLIDYWWLVALLSALLGLIAGYRFWAAPYMKRLRVCRLSYEQREAEVEKLQDRTHELQKTLHNEAAQRETSVLKSSFEKRIAQKEEEILGITSSLTQVQQTLKGEKIRFQEFEKKAAQEGEILQQLKEKLEKTEINSNALAQQERTLRNDLEKTKENLKQRDGELVELRVEKENNAELRQQLSSLKNLPRELELQKRENGRLAEEIGKAGQARSVDADKLEQLTQKLKIYGKLEEENRALKDQVKSDSQQFRKAREQILKATTENSKIGEQIKSLESKHRDIDAILAKKKADRKTVEQENNQLKEQLDRSNRELEKSNIQLREITEESQKLNTQLKKIESNRQKIDATAAQKEESLIIKIRKAEEQRDENKKEAAQNAAELKAAQKSIKSLESKFLSVRDTMGKNDEKVRGLVSFLDTLNIDLKQQKDRYLDTVKQLSASQRAQKSEAQKLIAAKKQADHYRAQMQELRTDLRSAKSASRALVTKESKLKAVVEKEAIQRAQVKELRSELNHANRLNRTADAKVGRLEKSLKAANAKKVVSAPKKKKTKLRVVTTVKKKAVKKTSRSAKITRPKQGQKRDPKLGLLYKKRPQRVDNLQEISGVGPLLEKKLHKFGVYHFEQIAGWKQSVVDEFSKRLSFSGRVEREQWIRQAAKLARGAKNTPTKRKPVVKKKAVRKAKKKSAVVRSASKSKSSSKKTRLKTGQVSDKKLGVLYKRRPSQVDDLTEISGVAKVLENKLHSFGVYRFEQIAHWNQAVVDEFSKRLSFVGRVEREKWIKQAAVLHRKKYGSS